MALRTYPTLSLTCAAALTTLLAGCPGEEPEVSTESGTTTNNNDGSTTVTPTTTPMTTEPGTSSGEPTTTGLDSSTTVAVDDTTTGEPMTDSSSGGSSSGGSTDTGTGSTTGEPPAACGNGMLDPGEDCDGDVGGAACLDQGFDDGVLACDPVACTFDVTGCFFVESLQNDNGMCDVNELGCADATGTAGNPQDAVECYQSTLVPPIDVTQVQYAFGDSVPPPAAADLVIFEWAGPGNAPGMLVDQIPLDPATDIVVGAYDFVLPTPVNLATAGFCVGVSGTDPADGFRLDFADGDAPTGETYLRASACGVANFAEATALTFPGNFCIRPTVTSNNP